MIAGLVLAAVLGQAAPPPAGPTPSTPPPAAAAAARPPSAAELKAALVRLQAQVLERDREIGTLRTRVAELELAALARAVATLDPDVRALLGVTEAPPAPAATPPAAPPRP